MKAAILLALVAVACAASDYSRYENFDVNEIIDNERLMEAYAACFLGSGKCTPEGSDFKKWIPEAIQTDCANCSEHQKQMIAKVIKAVQKQLPKEWGQLNDIYNKEKKYDEKLEAFVKKYAN